MNPKDQIKENLSITDVVATYVRLEKSGGQFRARCPFHNERTPSFYVSPERRSFHCFGCQASGDIFSFVEKIENIPFYEALKILADRAGVSLIDKERNKEEGRLVALLKDATEHFKNNLGKSAEAKQYLMERGLTEETIAIFHIGYARNEWRDLFTYLASRGYSPEEMDLAGVEIKALNDNGSIKGWYDRFRGRIMFPIRNVSGATVGYSGRIMPQFVDPTVAQGKYVNTPETALYHKSKVLFGYDTAKKVMNETKEVVVVEGQMDLCMSYQAGVHNTVAVSGTAFTDEHIHLIKRFCDKVILSFDTDSAGQNALKKTALLCLLGGLDVYVVGDFSSNASSVGTKDPADLIRENPQLWVDAVKSRRHVIEMMTDMIVKSEEDARIRGQSIVREVLPFVRALTSSIDRVHFIKLISLKTSIPEEVLTDELRKTLPSFIESNEVEEVVRVPRKERLIREIFALARYLKIEGREDIKELNLKLEDFPDAIIEQEIFILEEKSIVDKEMYLKDIVKAYQKELHQEVLLSLKESLKDSSKNQEAILREIDAHMRKG